MTDGERKLCEWWFGLTGSFFTGLFELLCRADDTNQARLAKGFPEEAAAYRRYSREWGGWRAMLVEWRREQAPGMVGRIDAEIAELDDLAAKLKMEGRP